MIKIFASTSLLALVAATSAFAQTTPATDAGHETVDSVVVTASRSGDATPVDLIGSSVTVIGAQQMQDEQIRVVADALSDTPGVSVDRAGAIGGFTEVRIRGAEANQTLVLIDGIKASDPYYGEYDFGTLLADEDAKIEVLRGQQSSLYGSDAIGGVIQYITLTGAEDPGIKLRAEGGSFGTYSAGGRVAGVTDGGDLDYALSTSYLHTDGYPVAIGGHRDVGSDNLGATFKTIWTPLPNLHFTAVGRYSHTDADTDDSDTDTSSPTFGQTIDSPGVHYVNTGLYGLVSGQLDLFDGHWTNLVTAQVADTQRTGYDVVDPFSPPAGQPIGPAYGDHGRRVKGSFVSAYRFGTDRIKQRVTVALDDEQESEQTTVSQFGDFLGWRAINNIGLVGEYDLTVDDRLAVGASVRQDFNDKFADSTTYHADASYRFDTGTRLHAAGGSGVKEPTFSELYDSYLGHYIGNPGLQPEKSQGWEAGVEQSLFHGRITLDATYFDSHLTDEITSIFNSSGLETPINLPGSSPQDGVELSAEARLAAGWRLGAVYTFLQAPQDEQVLRGGVITTFSGQAVRRAENTASASVTWAPPGRPFSGTLTVRYSSAQNDLAYTDPSYIPLLVQLKAFTLVNLSASYQVTRHLEVYGRIENLLNQHYTEVYSFAAPGVGAYGGLRYRF